MPKRLYLGLMDFGISNPNPGPYFDAFEEPPPPVISSEGIVVTDITEKFRAAAATLEPGELVKDAYFTLFESVGALEVMDPKMDSGCLAPGESLDDDYDVTRPLLPAEVIGIIDQLLSLEITGKEEDFVTNPYNRSLLESIDRYEIRDEIMEARKIIHDISHTLTDELAHALGFRLELRSAFLRAIELSELRSDPESLSLPWSQMQGVWEVVNKTRHLGKPVPEAFSTKIQRRLASTMPPRPIVQPSAEETHEHFKKLIADGINVLNVLHYSDSQSLLNFVLTFQAQKPQPMVYIRAILQNFLFNDMVILGRLSIRQVLDDDLSIVVLPSSLLLDRDNDSVEAPHHPRYAIAHQMELFRQRAAQSYLDIFRTFCQNRCRVRRTLFHSLQDWEMVQADAEEIDQLLQLQTEEKPITYPPLGGVPSHSLPLSSWAYHYKLRLMEWTVQLGFELEIYQPDELPGMYWYLSHLSHTRVLHLERIRFFTAQRLEPPGAASSSKTRPAAPSPELARSKSYLYLAHIEAAATSELADALSQLYTALLRLGLVAPPPRPYSTDALRYEVRMKPFAPIGLPALPSFEAFTHAVQRPEASTAALLDGAARAAGRARATLEGLVKMGAAEVFAVGCVERWTAGVKEWNKAAIAVVLAVGVVKRVVDEVGETGAGVGVGERLGVQVPRPEEGYHEWWVVPKVVEK
ncbi:hypothetical protein CHGG_08240 [Chaetomium globosum CBS 148.51]|uniref:Uncharacterized protein n=1 Tax=Chaetomium globosum (strain ATCC 6205 / CBS 148.51 / DSM 1962 / NBRC 6347 / NRRL 1970) TaxID=306901 RepID=Q2GUW4_CHAGB|nr:uncharacterized protein CHGG_08240 [Chaetomium globosum CBS 148.51]EAQ86987.1 hypothetical protein CHGG_08240 [Chaetomium globosum CBS 148.51]